MQSSQLSLLISILINTFKIGQDVCRWIAQPKQSNVITQVADGREIDLTNATLVTKDAILSDIVSTLVAHQTGINFSFSGAYVVASVEDKLRRQGVENPDEVARNKSIKLKMSSNPYACDLMVKLSICK